MHESLNSNLLSRTLFGETLQNLAYAKGAGLISRAAWGKAYWTKGQAPVHCVTASNNIARRSMRTDLQQT